MSLARSKQNQGGDPAPLRAVAWLRVSTEEQAREGRAGLPRQRESAERVARAKGYRLIETMEVSDVSGTATALAPEMRRLLTMVETGAVDVVIVTEMSRLLRPDDLSALTILDSFKRTGVLIDVAGSAIDLGSPEGFLAGGIQAILGGHERMQLLRKMIQSKEERRRMGRCPSSAVTLPTAIGYDRGREQWIVTDEIWRVREAFRLIDEEGLRCIREVARRVGLKGATMANLLRNPIYKGVRVIDEKRNMAAKATKPDGRQGDRPKMKRHPEEVITVRVFPPGSEPVPPARWDRVNEVLAQISTSHKLMRRRGRQHLLSGIARCGYCGERLYSRRNSARSGRFGYYICACRHESRRHSLPRCKQPWLPIEELEALTLAFVEEILSLDAIVADIIAESDRRTRQTIESFPLAGPGLAKALGKLKAREERLLTALEHGALSIDEFKARKAKLAEERARIRDLQDTPRTAQGSSGADGPGPFAARIARGAAAMRAATSDAERRRLLQDLLAEVYFRGSSIIAFMFAPGVLPEGGGQALIGIAHGLVSLDEPFRITNPTVPDPPGMRRCTKCATLKPLEAFHRKRRSAGAGPENRVARCAQCQNAENASRSRRRRRAGTAPRRAGNP